MARETVSKAGVPIIPEVMVHQMKKKKLPKKLVFPKCRWRRKGMSAHNASSAKAPALKVEKAFGDGSLYVEKYLESQGISNFKY